MNYFGCLGGVSGPASGYSRSIHSISRRRPIFDTLSCRLRAIICSLISSSSGSRITTRLRSVIMGRNVPEFDTLCQKVVHKLTNCCPIVYNPLLNPLARIDMGHMKPGSLSLQVCSLKRCVPVFVSSANTWSEGLSLF